MRKSFKIFLIVCWITIALFSSGCVYYRFFLVQSQLSSFSKNFKIETKDQVHLVFQKPVLRPSDMNWLFGLSPTKTVEKENQTIHRYEFKKIRKGRTEKIEHDDIVLNLTYEKGTPFFKQKQSGALNPVEEETEEWFYQYAVDEMENSLFQRYEISNFSLAGFESKHNTNYWDLVPYLGVGPSAHSFDGQRRFWNVNHFLKYLRNLEREEIPVAKTEHLTEIMNLEEWIFLQLRQVKGFRFVDLKNRFGISVSDWKKELSKHFGPEWQKWIKIDVHTLSLTQEGMRVSESIYPVFMDWLEGIIKYI